MISRGAVPTTPYFPKKLAIVLMATVGTLVMSLTLVGAGELFMGSGAPAAAEQLAAGEALYRRHCSDCHGPAGQGVPGAVPALAGNRVLTMTPPVNAVRAVLQGGFAPATQANPRPHGMPPLALSDADVAALLSWLRQAWGARAGAVSALQVQQAREAGR